MRGHRNDVDRRSILGAIAASAMMAPAAQAAVGGSAPRDASAPAVPRTPSGITYLAQGLRFPEGPIAMPDGSVLFVEIAGGNLSRLAPFGTVSVVARLGGGPNGAAVGPDGFCYVCNNGGFHWLESPEGARPGGQAEDYSGGRIERVDLRSGKVERLYDKGDAGSLKAPNDLVFDRSGGFWFTDTGSGRKLDLDRGAVYYARPDGSLIRQAIFPMLQPNGIGLSPNEDVLYVAETVTGRLWAFDIEAPGTVRHRPWPSPNGGRLFASLSGYRLFDSLAVDAAGNIAVATINDGGIVVYSPDEIMIDDIRLPDRFVTNICFGGEGGNTAFITLSQTGRIVSIPWKYGARG